MICLICVQNYTKKFGDKTVANDISFTAKDGAITGFIGHNGAGKSTTIKVITTGIAVKDVAPGWKPDKYNVFWGRNKRG